MPGSMITKSDLPTGICYNHKHPVFWFGTIVIKQGSVTVNGIPAASDGDMVFTSCGDYGYLISNCAATTINGVRACGGYTSIIGPGVVGSVTGMAANVTVS